MSENMEQEYLSIRGGARVGSVNATWPLAQLIVRRDSIDVKVMFIGSYAFLQNQVVSIKKYTVIPRLGWGIQIVHNVIKYPKKIIFWTFRDPQEVIAQIQASGFSPSADPVDVPSDPGMPVKWRSVVLIIVLWNFLLILASHGGVPQLGLSPRALMFIALGSLFLGTVFFNRSARLQDMILKPGRSPDEIKAWVKLLAIVSGVLFAGLLVTLLSALVPK